MKKIKNILNKVKSKVLTEKRSILDLNNDLKKYSYITSDDMKYVYTDSIGEFGEELSIMILSCNRVENTIKLIDSIQKYLINFKGEIVVVDNNSNDEQLEMIQDYLKSCKIKNSLVCFDENFGIAGGRQKGMEYITTKWVMFLDNDIYVTTDFVKKLNDDILLLGCHFINMPLMDETEKSIFTNGGNFYINYVDKEHIYVGSGSSFYQGDCEKNTKFEPSLSTFIYGGTSVMKVETFNKLGGFDTNMFIGFEDSDFSIRVLRNGYKIGNCGMLALVHDHSNAPKNSGDTEYEKTRFSNNRLRESAMYFEKKNGFKVWSRDLEKWLEDKNKELELK